MRLVWGLSLGKERKAETNPIEATRTKARIISNLRRNPCERSHYAQVLYSQQFMRVFSLIFDKAGPSKGSSTLPIHGYRFIFNMMSDLTTDCRTRQAGHSGWGASYDSASDAVWDGLTMVKAGSAELLSKVCGTFSSRATPKTPKSKSRRAWKATVGYHCFSPCRGDSGPTRPIGFELMPGCESGHQGV